MSGKTNTLESRESILERVTIRKMASIDGFPVSSLYLKDNRLLEYMLTG